MDRVELNSDPLRKVSGSSLVIERGNLTKGGQPGFPVEISHRQSRWILHTNDMVTRKQTLKVLKQSNLEFISTTDLYLPLNKNFHWNRNKYNKRADSPHSTNNQQNPVKLNKQHSSLVKNLSKLFPILTGKERKGKQTCITMLMQFRNEQIVSNYQSTYHWLVILPKRSNSQQIPEEIVTCYLRRLKSTAALSNKISYFKSYKGGISYHNFTQQWKIMIQASCKSKS